MPLLPNSSGTIPKSNSYRNKKKLHDSESRPNVFINEDLTSKSAGWD